MKIWIKDVPLANIDDVYLTLEGKDRLLKAIWAMCDSVQPVEKTPGATYDFWVDLAMPIQAVGCGAGALNFTVITDDGINVYKSINSTNVGQFREGVSYLIPFSAGVVVPMFPPIPGATIPTLAGTRTETLNATHFFYQALGTHNPINAVNVDVYTFEVIPSAFNQKQRKAAENASARSRMLNQSI